MSYHLINFIPEDPFYKLNASQTDAIKQLDWSEDIIKIEVNETVQLVMKYEGFGDVLCPFCGCDLFDWWGDAMGAAYSEENGFEEINVTTPCCNKTATLQSLAYSPPIGLYKSIIVVSPKVEFFSINIKPYGDMKIHKEIQNDGKLICDQLKMVTGIVRRILSRCFISIIQNIQLHT